MSNCGIWDYLLKLRQNHVYRNNQIKFLSHIAIYTDNLKVYKVAVFANSNKKNGKRYGVNEMVKIVEVPDHVELKNEIPGSEIGTKIFIYNFKKDEVLCFGGEQK